MTDLQRTPTIDVDKLMAFVFKAVDEVGATLNMALVVLGDKLGYYTTMAVGPVTPAQLASATGTGEPYAQEWLYATQFPGAGYDLVTTFDALHDMGDPVGAARHVYAALAPEGTWMVVEPTAGDSVSDNLNPVGRAYYGFPHSCAPRRRWPKRSVWPWAPRLGRTDPRRGHDERLHSIHLRRTDPLQLGPRNQALTVVGHRSLARTAPM